MKTETPNSHCDWFLDVLSLRKKHFLVDKRNNSVLKGRSLIETYFENMLV